MLLGVGKMRLVRLVHLSASSAIKVRINVKHRIRDTLKIQSRSGSVSGLRFGQVRVRVSNAIMRKNNRHTRAMSVMFRTSIVQVEIRKNDVNRVRGRDRVWTNVKGLIW